MKGIRVSGDLLDVLKPIVPQLDLCWWYLARGGHPSPIIVFGVVACSVSLLMSVWSIPETVVALRHRVDLQARGGEVRVSVRKAHGQPMELVAKCVEAEVGVVPVSEEIHRICLTLATHDGMVRVYMGGWPPSESDGTVATKLATILQVDVSMRRGSHIVGKAEPWHHV